MGASVSPCLVLALRRAEAAHHQPAPRGDLLVAGEHHVGEGVEAVGGGEAGVAEAGAHLHLGVAAQFQV